MASSRNGMLLALVLVSVLGGLSLTAAQRVRYDGYQVWRVQPQSSLELNLVDTLVTKFNLSYWLYPSAVDRPIDFMVAPQLVEPVKPFFQEAFSNFQVLITDVQQVSDDQISNRAKPGLGYEYGEYHPLEEIEAWMDQMVEGHGDLVTKQSLGKSYEGRDMNYLKISTGTKTKTRNATASKQAMFIQGGIHAREWISPATVTYMTNLLLKQYATREAVEEILNGLDWYVLPVFNVDGYTYTWTNDRLWRKTRSPTTDPNCVGVDPNRNWDNHWCESGASKNPCSETYCGGKPFSEVEVLAVSEFLQSGPDFLGFIDFHSYSQLWMTPWAWTTDLPPDFLQQDMQSQKCVDALGAVHGTFYRFGTIANTLYAAAGSSIDWTYADADILYSATVELRDTGRYGFLLPPDQIIPTGEETLEGLIQFAQYMLNDDTRV